MRCSQHWFTCWIAPRSHYPRTASSCSQTLQQVVILALRKLQMGALPNVQEQLASFLGMPSTCRKSILAPLDKIKELSLQWVLMPKLDSRGCIQVKMNSILSFWISGR